MLFVMDLMVDIYVGMFGLFVLLDFDVLGQEVFVMVDFEFDIEVLVMEILINFVVESVGVEMVVVLNGFFLIMDFDNLKLVEMVVFVGVLDVDLFEFDVNLIDFVFFGQLMMLMDFDFGLINFDLVVELLFEMIVQFVELVQ